MQEPYVVASWPAVPVEIVRAAGFRAVMARGASAPTPAADAHLEPGIFPNRLRHLVEDALTGRLSRVARVIIPRTSDADYKCFLYLREFVRTGVATALAPVVLFDLLQSRGADVRNHDVARTRALLDALASCSGRMPSADDLRREITRANAARAAARRLVALRHIVPRATGTDVFPLLAAFWEMEPDRYVEMASEAVSKLADVAQQAGTQARQTASSLAADANQKAKGFLNQRMAGGADLASHIADSAKCAADKVAEFSQDIRGKSVDQLLRDASDYTRHRPAVVFGLASLAGFLLLRVIKANPGKTSEATGREVQLRPTSGHFNG